MPPEETLGQLLAERRWPVAALALVADIDESTATRIKNGQCRPRGTTAIRMAEGLGIGYDRMRRILAATWEGRPGRSGIQRRERGGVTLSPEARQRAGEIAAAAPPLSDAIRNQIRLILWGSPALSSTRAESAAEDADAA